jgi:hypothetical protein
VNEVELELWLTIVPILQHVADDANDLRDLPRILPDEIGDREAGHSSNAGRHVLTEKLLVHDRRQLASAGIGLHEEPSVAQPQTERLCVTRSYPIDKCASVRGLSSGQVFRQREARDSGSSHERDHRAGAGRGHARHVSQARECAVYESVRPSVRRAWRQINSGEEHAIGRVAVVDSHQRHSASLRMATGAAFSRSSWSVKNRPRAGATPSVSSTAGDTRATNALKPSPPATTG